MTTDQEATLLNNMEAVIAAPQPAPRRGRTLWQRFSWLAIFPLAFGAYTYAETAVLWSSAESECLAFAEKNAINPARTPDPADPKLFVARKWIKANGLIVVELGQKEAGKDGVYRARLCVVGNGQIGLPGLFEQWQYR